jgi:hypothetical protein
MADPADAFSTGYQCNDIRADWTEDALLDLASELEPDGGMPGANPSARLARSIAAIFAFVQEGHTISTGPFRSHVARLVGFLKSAAGLSNAEKALVERTITAASTGRILSRSLAAAGAECRHLLVEGREIVSRRRSPFDDARGDVDFS